MEGTDTAEILEPSYLLDSNTQMTIMPFMHVPSLRIREVISCPFLPDGHHMEDSHK